MPGTVAGLLKALEEHGTMNREQVMAPAIALAEDGIEVTAGLSESLTALVIACKMAEHQKVFSSLMAALINRVSD